MEGHYPLRGYARGAICAGMGAIYSGRAGNIQCGTALFVQYQICGVVFFCYQFFYTYFFILTFSYTFIPTFIDFFIIPIFY